MDEIKKSLEKQFAMLSEQGEKNADNLEALLSISHEMCNIAQTISYIEANLNLRASSTKVDKSQSRISDRTCVYSGGAEFTQQPEPQQINGAARNPIC